LFIQNPEQKVLKRNVCIWEIWNSGDGTGLDDTYALPRLSCLWL